METIWRPGKGLLSADAFNSQEANVSHPGDDYRIIIVIVIVSHASVLCSPGK